MTLRRGSEGGRRKGERERDELEEDVDGIKVEKGLERDMIEYEEWPDVKVGFHKSRRVAEKLNVQVFSIEAGLG